MDFTGIRRRKTHQPVLKDSLSETYPCDLQMYTTPPEGNITLGEFEDIAIDRLKVLRIMEIASIRGYKYLSEEYKNFIRLELKKEGLKVYLYLLGFAHVRKEPDYQARRTDHISHFILRLAYSRSQNLRSWFLSHELELFRLRFTNSSHEDINKFFEVYNLIYKPITSDEKESVRSELMESTFGMRGVAFDTAAFYKVKFQEVPNLVTRRGVYIQAGWAYVPYSELIACVQGVFRKNLNQGLTYCSGFVYELDDFRINDVIRDIQNTYTGKSYVPDEDTKTIDIEYLDWYATKHFPLCMQVIHEVLRATHEMKHNCRLQYGLFLKGIGVSFDDAMRFWKEEFTKRITNDQFDKQYAYNVRHQYGKVGNRTNYSPYSCCKIIEARVGPGEHHGCPFRHWDVDKLKTKLVDQGISAEGVTEITNLCKDKHYQMACNKHFEYKHHQASGNIIMHPNQYFEESVSLSKGKDNKNNVKKHGKSMIEHEPMASTSFADVEMKIEST